MIIFFAKFKPLFYIFVKPLDTLWLRLFIDVFYFSSYLSYKNNENIYALRVDKLYTCSALNFNFF